MNQETASALGPEERRELARFSRAISLADGFVFHVVVADTRRVADVALAEVFSDVIRIRPHTESFHSSDDIAFLILNQLEQALREAAARPIVLDATRTKQVEEKGWRRAFQHLNEQRNRIMRDLQRPLILCVSPPLESAFGHEAPDFWSIRGSGMRLYDRTPPPPPQKGTDKRIRVSVKTSRGYLPDTSTIEAQQTRVAEARGETPRALAIELSRLGTLYQAAGQPVPALEVISEAVEIRRQLAASNGDILPELASSLDHLGTVLSALGRREEALNTCLEAVESMSMVIDPDSSRLGLAESLGHLGDAHSEMGQDEQALAATREAADTYRQLAESHPDAFLPKLSTSLSMLGHRLNVLGRREQAFEAFTEAVELRRQLAASHPDTHLPELANSLRNLSATLKSMERYQQAFSAEHEADEILETLAPVEP